VPAFWPDTRGFLGGTQDTTGLTHLGAREFDPATGMFVSFDPMIDPNSPNALGGYSYAENNPVTKADPSGEMLPPEDRALMGGGGSGTGYKPLTQPNKTTYVDQNGTPHYVRPRTYDVGGDQDTASFLNQRLQAAGEYYDANTKSGSMFILQDEDSQTMQKLKGAVKLPNGEVTVAGTTSDAIKVSWIDGKMVSVDSYDFTGGDLGREQFHVNTAVNKMRTDDGRGAKKQTQNVVLVAKNDEQAEKCEPCWATTPTYGS
jgi:RHS repeat-associated protein